MQFQLKISLILKLLEAEEKYVVNGVKVKE